MAAACGDVTGRPQGVSFSRERGRDRRFGAVCAADGGPAPFGPTWDPPAAGRPRPLSTERPGPTRVTPPDRPERSVVAARALSLAPSDGAPVRHTVPDPAAPRRARRIPRSGVRWWTRPNLPAPRRRLSTVVRPAASPPMPRSARRMRRSRTGEDHRPVGRVDHSPGRTNTVRPPTTVRRQTGRSPPGDRSGRPGVPERGSVDQRATRSSGAWTTSSPVRHTA